MNESAIDQTSKKRAAAVEAILQAELQCWAIPPLSSQHPDLSVEEAYCIQALLNDTRQKRQLSFAGYKIGLTSRSAQIACGYNQPLHGRIFSQSILANGSSLPSGLLIGPLVEAELAFILGRDLEVPTATMHDVLRATDFVTPALEIIDHRMEAPRTIADAVADNSGYAAAVLSDQRFRPSDIDTRWIGATLARNNVIEDSGVSAISMGHPAICVAWLANTLFAAGTPLRRGSIVMSGAFTKAIALRRGDEIEADFGSYGQIKLSCA